MQKERVRSNQRSPALLHIVLIDQEPVRRAAAARCTEARAQLDTARAGWHRFEREDKPAFARWRAREFGPLLSKAREIEMRIRERQDLVHEVEMEMRRGFQDAHTAYRKVMFRRENPSAVAEEPGDVHPDKTGKTKRLSEFEKEALFQEWVQKSLGTHPDKMDDEAYSISFEAFKSHMFRSAREEPRRANTYRPAEKMDTRSDKEEEEKEDTSVDVRVKELYRILVRRLHPDLRADCNGAVSALWHEVQEAYAACDVARMEILLALSDIESNHMSDATSVSQMQSVLAELRRALRALKKSLQEAEGEDAWNFTRTGPDPELRLCVERQLKSDLATRSIRLDVLTRTIAAWAQGPIANRKVLQARGRQFA